MLVKIKIGANIWHFSEWCSKKSIFFQKKGVKKCLCPFFSIKMRNFAPERLIKRILIQKERK